MRLPRLILFVLGVSLLLPVAARADPIVRIADDYGIGTDVSALFPGLSLTRLTRNAGDPALVADISPVAVVADDYSGYVGRRGFGTYASPEAFDTLTQSYSVLELAFANPTSFVQIESVWLSDSPLLRVYTGSTELGWCYFGSNMPGCAFEYLNDEPGGTTGTLSIQSPSHDITRIVYGGILGNSAALEIRYETVPEPSTLLLMGLAGLFCMRNRRRGVPK